MKPIQLEYLLELRNLQSNKVRILDFDLVKSDWVYLKGNGHLAKEELHRIVTLQTQPEGEKAQLFGANLLSDISSKSQDIRSRIAKLDLALEGEISEDNIISQLNLFGIINQVEIRERLEYVSKYFNADSSSAVSLIFGHLKLKLCTKPEILIVDHSFDVLDKKDVAIVVNALFSFASNTKTSIIICTNNEALSKSFKGRSYTTQNNVITELDA